MKEIDKEALKANKVLSIKDVEADLKEIEKFNCGNNINYKLKDFVTDEMLVECGFVKCNSCLLSNRSKTWDNFTIKTTNENVELYFMKNTNYELYKIDEGIIEDNFGNCEDITPYIQDLIEKGYVEVVE